MSRRMPAVLVAALAAGALAAAPAPARSEAPKPNSGREGSSCKGVPFTGSDPGPDAGLDTSSLGAAAPASYEIGAPTSMLDRFTAPRRVMILVHGGSWFVVGRRAMRIERELAAKWRAAGWQTVSVTYGACAESVGDVTRFYDLIRARVGPSIPICLLGQSAGGHLALMVAAKRPDVACVISIAAPTDLRTIRAQGRQEAAIGAGPATLLEGSQAAENLAIAAFGRRRLRARSPVALARRIRARLLLANADDDVLIPRSQATALAAAVAAAHSDAYVDVDRLAPGSRAFVHGSASAAAIRDFDDRTAALVAPFGRAPTDAGSVLPPWPSRAPFPGFGPMPRSGIEDRL